MPTNKKDFKKEYKQFYNPTKKAPSIVEVPEFQFIMIDGIDARETNKIFQESIQVLFQVSFKIKFNSKKYKELDYTVMPLEGLWWSDNPDDFIKGNKEKWQWTLMIMQPNFINQADFEKAVEEADKKKPSDLLKKLRLEKYTESLSTQIMHIGSFSEEHENIMKLHDLIKTQNGTFNGKIHKHHEIYLSDFRKTAPEKLRTVIRQPFVVN